MQKAQRARTLGFGIYGFMTAVAVSSFWKPELWRILLIGSAAVSLVCLLLMILAIRKAAPAERRWARYEGWVIYSMFAVSVAFLVLGIFATPIAPVVVLVFALCAGVLIASIARSNNDDWPPDYGHHYY